MKTKAVRIHGVRDLRLDEFELPQIGEDEILAKIITDSLCLSTYKVSKQGSKHKKLPDNLDKTPIVMGHEFCGIIEKVGKKWEKEYKPGDKFVAQPNLGRADTYSLGYSFPYVGGESTYSIIMNEAIEKGCLLKYNGDSFFEAALVEPLSCIVAGFKANFHLRSLNEYDHTMGIKEGGSMLIMGGTGPMGSLAIDYAIHRKVKPSILVVTGRTKEKIDHLKKLYPEAEAKKHGVTLTYVLTPDDCPISELCLPLSKDQKGFDDLFLMVAKEHLVTEAEKCLARDGCFNFFAGPVDSAFSSTINFYNIHYNAAHYVGTSGSNTQDMIDAIHLIEDKIVDVSKIATHILGLNDVCESILDLPNIPGGKKIVYSQKNFPITDVNDFTDETVFTKKLKELVEAHNGLWSSEAEQYFLEHAPSI